MICSTGFPVSFFPAFAFVGVVRGQTFSDEKTAEPSKMRPL
jgi:hypothetical protein